MILAAHLQAPLLTFDDELLNRLAKHIDVQEIGSFKANWSLTIAGKVLELYRDLVLDFSDRFHEKIEEENVFSGVTKKIRKTREKNFKATAGMVQKINKKRSNFGALNFHYLAWNLLPVIREYVDQHVLRPEVIRGLCGQTFLLLAALEKSKL